MEPGFIKISFNHVKEIVHVICYVLILLQFFKLTKENKRKLLLKVFGFEKIFIWYGLLEFICVKFLNRQTEILKCVMFVVGDSFIYAAGNISLGVGNRLQGINSEPSMYGVALFIFVLLGLYLYKENKDKKTLAYILLALVLMVSSLAFSAIVCLAWLAAFWIIMKYQEGGNQRRAVILTLAGVSIVIAVVLYRYLYMNSFSNYYLQRIHMALINLDDLSIGGWSGNYEVYDGSTKIRLVSMIGTLLYFIKRPLFGLALGSTYSHSSFATILASIGFVGTVIWGKFTFFASKVKYNFYYIFILALWCGLLFIAGVGLFQFYGVQNITIISVFGWFLESAPNLEKVKTECIWKNL